MMSSGSPGQRQFVMPPHIWFGVSAGNQPRADERVPELLRSRVSTRFVSYEPALGPVDFTPYLPAAPIPELDFHPRLQADLLRTAERRVAADWIIIGGESGTRARRFELAWARSVIQQCKAAGVACFTKQLGGNLSDNDLSDCARAAGSSMHDRKGANPLEWPEELRVREFPVMR